MNTPKPPAGGRATASGMDFQAGVGVWFAAYLISEMPVGGRFGLSRDTLVRELKFETGTYLDDIELRLSDGGAIFVQCKTRLSLSEAPESDLSATVNQVVKLYRAWRASDLKEQLSRCAAVLAVSTDAPGTLDHLEYVCRYYDLGGRWNDPSNTLNQDQQSAARIFEALIRASWGEEDGDLTGENFAGLARLFHITRFDVGSGGADLREASGLIGRRLFGQEDKGIEPLKALLGAVRRLMRTGATTDGRGLIQYLRSEGYADTLSPRFGPDIARLEAATTRELQRLRRHSRLPIAGGVPILRDCLAPFSMAVEGGSILVTGEPGAGKTGVLVSFAEQTVSSGSAVVFLSVDRFAGIATLDDLRTELGLTNSLLDALVAWPGTSSAFLVIDALDASRGGPSEWVFAKLIEEGLSRLGERWSIVASIRTFDLRNGRAYQTIMAGAPPDPKYAEGDLNAVRHFKVPALSPDDLSAVGTEIPELGKLVDTAPPAVQDLLTNVFNLALAAELVDRGVTSDNIRTVTTQSELIEKYEDQRLPSGRLRIALTQVVTSMVRLRKLAIRKIEITHEALDDLMTTGVLGEADDRISFSHHILFDHAAGRFYLDWDDAVHLREQVTREPQIGFLLGPALRFAMERIWRDDFAGRKTTWRLVADIVSAEDLDPIVASVALRSAAQNVTTPEDVAGLCGLMKASGDDEALASAVGRLSRFVNMSLSGPQAPSSHTAIAWALVAESAIETKDGVFADAARLLLWTLCEKADLSNIDLVTVVGRAARKLLGLIWTHASMHSMAGNAIRFVSRTFATDPAASRELLQQILEEPRFGTRAHEDGSSLAEGISTIFSSDPEFAAHIYAALFGRPAPSEEKTWVGGKPSRILPLVSNAKQDYEHVRWRLRRALPSFFMQAPTFATRAVNQAAIGLATEGYSRSLVKNHSIRIGSAVLRITEDDRYPQEWRKSERTRAAPEEEVLGSFAEFIADCPAEVFRIVAHTVISEESASSVWSRLVGTAADRLGVADDLLWPIASAPEFLEITGVSRDAIVYLSAVYGQRSQEERARFEASLLARIVKSEQDKSLRLVAARFLSTAPDEDLATPEIRKLKEELAQSSELRGNRPLMSIESGWSAPGNMTERMLIDSGVDLEAPPDRELREAVRPLEEALRVPNETLEAAQVASLWAQCKAVIEMLAGLRNPEPHEESLHAAWGQVSNAIERLAKSESYDPKAAGHPSVSTLLDVLDRMAESAYPVARDESDPDLMSWGNWDIRVYAASSVMWLASRFSATEPSIIGRLRSALRDPVSTVRLQVAQSLNMLWEVARSQMWSMIEMVAEEENHEGVLGFFVSGPLSRLVWAAPEQVEAVASKLLMRRPAGEPPKHKGKRDTFEEAVGAIAAQLWVGQGRATAQKWIDGWIADLKASKGYLGTLLFVIRSALFEDFNPKKGPGAKGVQDRAWAVLHQIVAASANEMALAIPLLQSKSTTDADLTAAQEAFQNGDQLLDHACSQIYFGSGVFEHETKGIPQFGLTNLQDMRRFLGEHQVTLELIGKAATARTLHHLLELYEYVAAAEPEIIFDQIASLLVGQGASQGYHLETLGSHALVRLIRRYLADYRFVFDDPPRRGKLVQVLELFSGVGWPDALKLLYDLPELLR